MFELLTTSVSSQNSGEFLIKYNGLTTFLNMKMGHKCSESRILHLCKLWDSFFAPGFARSPSHLCSRPFQVLSQFHFSLLILSWPTISFDFCHSSRKVPSFIFGAYFPHTLIRSRYMSRCHMLFQDCLYKCAPHGHWHPTVKQCLRAAI